MTGFCGCDELRCALPGFVGFGVGERVVLDVVELEVVEPVLEVEVEVEEEGELDVEVVGELDVEVVAGGCVVVVVVVVEELDDVGVVVVVDELVVVDVVVVVDELVVVVAPHVSVSEATSPVIGRSRLEIGVPGGTFTLKVRVGPSTSLTMMVQAFAEAIGNAATPIVTSIAPVIASTIDSFRRLGSVGHLLQLIKVCATSRTHAASHRDGRYCLIRSFATRNRERLVTGL